MPNAFLIDSPDAVETRSKRTPFAAPSPAEPRLLRGRSLGTPLFVRKIKLVDKGHIITPENAHRDTGEADLIAVGSRVEEIKPGDRITIREYSAPFWQRHRCNLNGLNVRS